MPSCLPPLLGYDSGPCQDLDDKLALARGVGGDVATVGCEPFLKFLVLAREHRVCAERIAEGQPLMRVSKWRELSYSARVLALTAAG